MLTAVNVARSCRMVEPKEQVLFVSACPPSHDKPAALKFIPAELSQGEEQPEEVSLEARSQGAQSTRLLSSAAVFRGERECDAAPLLNTCFRRR